MRFFLDHVIVAVRDLARATEDWERIGLIATDGGVHPKIGTRNAIVRFADRSFLELIAVGDREKLRANAPVLLALIEGHADGPFSWALRTDDIQGAQRQLVAAGVRVMDIWPGEAERSSGKVARWQTLHTQEPGFPFLVQYESAPTSEPSQAGLEAVGLGAVILSGPPELIGRLSHAFGADVRDGRVRFETGNARMEDEMADAYAIVGVELVVTSLARARARVGAQAVPEEGPPVDKRAHGLQIRLAQAN